MFSFVQDKAASSDATELGGGEEPQNDKGSLWESPSQQNLILVASLYARFMLVAVIVRPLHFTRPLDFLIALGVLLLATGSLINIFSIELGLAIDRKLFGIHMTCFSLLSCMTVISLHLDRDSFIFTTYASIGVAAVSAVSATFHHTRLDQLRWNVLTAVVWSAIQAAVWYFLYLWGNKGRRWAINIPVALIAAMVALLKAKFPEKLFALPSPQKLCSVGFLINMCTIALVSLSNASTDNTNFGVLLPFLLPSVSSVFTNMAILRLGINRDGETTRYWRPLLLVVSSYIFVILATHFTLRV